MLNKILKTQILVLFLYCFFPLFANEGNIKQGLYFFSYEMDKDKRTGLDLTPQKPLKFSKGFSMDFEFRLRSQGESFGYIFRMIGNDSLNIDLVSDVINLNNFSLIIGNKTFIQFNAREIPDFALDEWVKVSFIYNEQKHSVSLVINNISKSVDYSLDKIKDYNIFFGGNLPQKFSTTDVPPMIVKDIRIFNEKQQLIRNWKLEKHGDSTVFDECEDDKAVVVNPLWEIDSHAKWEKIKTISLPDTYQQIAYDKKSDRIFIVKGSYILVYHLQTNILDTISPLKGVPYNLSANQLVYDNNRGELISYCFEKDSLSRFDFQSQSWNNSNNSFIVPYFWHHSKYFDSEDSTLFALGGYGFHTYSGLLHKYAVRDKKWEQFDLSKSIAPRYLASMGNLNKTSVLFFGGYGNESGKQQESPHNYYDLYSLDKETLEVTKIWEIENVDIDFTNGNSLIVNEDNNTFYTVSYPNKMYESYITLHEYYIDRPEYRRLGDSIQYFFNDVESYCDLFRPADKSKLITLTSTVKKGSTEIGVYTIAYPPLSLSDTVQVQKSKAIDWKFVWLSIAALVLIVFIYFLVKKYKKDKYIQSVSSDLTHTAKIGGIRPESAEIIYPSINLLGDFQVTDSEEVNVTNSFTPTTKQIFLLLLLTTINNRQGVSSLEFRNFFWPDKDDDSARNNRNVYINRLRILLKNVGDIKIISDKGYWMLSLNDSVFCDYEKILSLISEIKGKPKFDKELLKEMLELAQRGKLLPYYEMEWLDNYKTAYSNLIIEFLLDVADYPELESDLGLLLQIAEVILLQDSIEESAVRLRCNILFRLGKKKHALQCYNKFAEEHLNLLGIETNLTFEDIVKNKK